MRKKSTIYNDEIDLIQIAKNLWKGKWKIAVVTITSVIVFFKRDLIKLEPTNPAPPVTIMRFFMLDMPGNVLLFRVLRQSTIGAERLDCRVRNGIGNYTFAIITRHRLILKKYYNVKINLLFLFLKNSMY